MHEGLRTHRKVSSSEYSIALHRRICVGDPGVIPVGDAASPDVAQSVVSKVKRISSDCVVQVVYHNRLRRSDGELPEALDKDKEMA